MKRQHIEDSKQKIRMALIGTKRGAMSDEHKKKLSISHMGKIPWNKNKKGIHLSPKSEFKKGDRGGKTYNEIYGDNAELEKHKRRIAHLAIWDKKGRMLEHRNKHVGSEYVRWRTAVFQRDNWTCQTCGVRGTTLNAHHIKCWAKYPELRFVIDNGITLCKPCHKLANDEQRRNKWL